jgi:hypothetical protein
MTCSIAQSADDISVNALDTIYWIDSSWRSVTETTIRNTFRSAGFVHPNSALVMNDDPDEDEEKDDDDVLNQLDSLLKHVSIGGREMSASDFVDIDSEVPSFNEWNDEPEHLLHVDIDQMDEEEANQDDTRAAPPKLSEAMEMLERFRLLSTTTHPQLHPIIAQLESQLTDLYLESKVSKQSKIEDFFVKQS